MDRGWYARLGLVAAITVGAWFVLWPSVAQWIPAPAWVTDNINRHITPGLDIQGGLRMMYTVDMDSAVASDRNAKAQQLLRRIGAKLNIIGENDAPTDEQLRRIRRRVQVQTSSTNPRLIRVTVTNPADLASIDRTLIRNIGNLSEEERTDRSITFLLTEESIDGLRELAVTQAQETIKNRVREMGILDANVRAQDIDIIVEVPGASEADFNRIRDIISRTARLEFKIVDQNATLVDTLDDLPEGLRRYGAGGGAYLFAEGPGPCPEGVDSDIARPTRGRAARTSEADEAPQCTARLRLSHYLSQVRESGRLPEGRDFVLGRSERATQPNEDEAEETEQQRRERASNPEAEDRWRTYVLHSTPPNGSDAVGGEHIEDAQVANDQRTNKPIVTFSMNNEGARRMQELTTANMNKPMAIVLDEVVFSTPTIEGRIGARGQITLGGMRPYDVVRDEARDLAIVLRAGALPAPIVPQNEQHIGPTLGRESVYAGAKGAVAGVILVLIFMILYYSVGGVIADLMVVLNLFFLFAMMAFFNNDLTLPGLAGIALTVGMAVDANVLINERMREELRMGKSPRAAVETGYRRAFWAIFDGQITTGIAGVVLLQYGSPEIQGFGLTLIIGIVSSLFTSVFCSKIAFDWLVRGLKVSRLRIG